MSGDDAQLPSKDQIRMLIAEDSELKHERGPSSVEVLAGLEQLHQQLVSAAKAYDAVQHNRNAVCDAIIATSEFLKGQGFRDATLLPLSRVIFSIVEVSRQNRSDPLFCQKANQTKARRGMEDAVRQGHLSALLEAWLKSSSGDEGDKQRVLERAARRLSGAYFGKLDVAKLRSAQAYQRQMGHHDLLYRSHKQMTAALEAEADTVGDREKGLRIAVTAQIDALNLRAEMRAN